ncbi:hypothetical protein [Streptomyces sp. NPDC058374]|uniref:hypothetical protein n=1 Tax=unclassified Streptomyces TaxID=2593676 RepID=UPI0036536301
MYISPRVLDGSRWRRLTVGTVLCLFMGFFGAVLTVVAIRERLDVLARVGVVAGAGSAFAVAWWCARYWYAAYCEGRRGEPVPEPSPWPWLLPWVVVVVALAVSGVRDLSDGDSQGWFAVGLAGLLGLPALGGLVALLYGRARDGVRGRRRAARVPELPAEPPRPRRDWGPVG